MSKLNYCWNILYSTLKYATGKKTEYDRDILIGRAKVLGKKEFKVFEGKKSLADFTDSKGKTITIPIYKEKINGYQIEHFGYAELVCIYEDVFVKQIYNFESDTDAPVIVDCGSNIGTSVLYFKKIYPNSKIICFEPCPTTFHVLKNNIEKNGLKNVTLNSKAVSDHEGKTTFYTQIGSNSADSIVPRNDADALFEVDVCRVSDTIKGLEKVDMLKIDVEGAEEKVINDLYTTGELGKAEKIFIEYHKAYGVSLTNILKMLEDTGFNCYVTGDYPIVMDNPTCMIYAYKIKSR